MFCLTITLLAPTGAGGVVGAGVEIAVVVAAGVDPYKPPPVLGVVDDPHAASNMVATSPTASVGNRQFIASSSSWPRCESLA
jgi:hypothetical protein